MSKICRTEMYSVPKWSSTDDNMGGGLCGGRVSTRGTGVLNFSASREPEAYRGPRGWGNEDDRCSLSRDFRLDKPGAAFTNFEQS